MPANPFRNIRPARRGEQDHGPDRDTSPDGQQSQHAVGPGQVPDGVGGRKKKKVAETLASVVRESNVGPALELMRSAQAFMLPDGQHAMILVLNTADIGGLSTKQKNDESKGSLIELISKDLIEVYATQEMIADEQLGFIPTDKTLARMDEYQMLVEAPLQWYSVQLIPAAPMRRYGSTRLLVAQGVALGEVKIEAVIGTPVPDDQPLDQHELPTQPTQVVDPQPSSGSHAAVSTEDSGTAGAGAYTPQSQDGLAAAASDSHDAPTQAVAATEEPGPADSDDFEEPFAQEAPPEHEPVSDEDMDALMEAEQESDPGYDEEIEEDDQDDDLVVEPEEVGSTIARRFFSADLDLALDMAPFEQFLASDEHLNPEPFTVSNENTGSWLNDYVASLAVDANGQINAMRNEHLEVLRRAYVELVSKGMEAIGTELDLSDPDSHYGNLKSVSDKGYVDDQRQVEEVTASRRKNIVERFETNQRQAGEAARQSAIARYAEQYGKSLDKDLNELPAAVAKMAEDKRVGRELVINTARRAEAERRLEVAVNATLSALSHQRAEQIQREAQLVGAWHETISGFIDENRKSDIAMGEALREDLERTDKITALKQANQAQLEELTRGYDEKVASLKAQISTERAEHEQRLRESLGQLETDLVDVRADAAAARQRSHDLQAELSSSEERYAARLADEVASVHHERSRAREAAQKALLTQARNNRMILVMAVLFILLALVVGFIMGNTMGGKNAAPVGPIDPASVSVVAAHPGPATSDLVTDSRRR